MMMVGWFVAEGWRPPEKSVRTSLFPTDRKLGAIRPTIGFVRSDVVTVESQESHTPGGDIGVAGRPATWT
jgi:hypothetical protein